MNLKDLKQEISKEAIEGYKARTNFSSCEFIVEVGNITLIAKPICLEKEVRYEFVLDTQWLSSNEVTYKEIVMIKNVMDILNENKKLAISRLKKWTVEEYKEDRRKREEQSEQMLEMLKNAFYNSQNSRKQIKVKPRKDIDKCVGLL